MRKVMTLVYSNFPLFASGKPCSSNILIFFLILNTNHYIFRVSAVLNSSIGFANIFVYRGSITIVLHRLCSLFFPLLDLFPSG